MQTEGPRGTSSCPPREIRSRGCVWGGLQLVKAIGEVVEGNSV